MNKFYTTKNILLTLCFFIATQIAMAQPEYVFNNYSHIGGTDLKIGASYRYFNVKSGVDAIVTITDMTDGVILDELDGTSGYDEAFQPTLYSPAYSNGYIEFEFKFVHSGNDVVYLQNEIPVSCIDIDGSNDYDGLGNSLHEFDQIFMGGGYTDFSGAGNEILVNENLLWSKGKNIGGNELPGRDTTYRNAMFTAVNANIGSFIARVGVTNNSSKDTYRLRSIYFKKFAYDFSILSVNNINQFSGVLNNTGAATLNWSIEKAELVNTVTLEKSNGAGFSSLYTKTLNNTQNAITMNYVDVNGGGLYRLKIVKRNGVEEYSQIVKLDATITGFKTYPTKVSNNIQIALNSKQNNNATVQIIDMNGKVLKQVQQKIAKGINNLSITELSNLTQGNYLIKLQSGEETYVSKFIK
jgi:Secretion system C-terminal sorting domain